MADQVSILIGEPVVAAGSAVTAAVNFRTRATASASTPASIRYRVDCLTTKRELVNWTSVSAASSASIVVPGTSNGIVSTGNDFETRQITVEADTDLSTQVRASATWKVRNIHTFDTVHSFDSALQLEPFFPLADVESGLTISHYQYPHGHRFRYLPTFDVLDAHYYRRTAAEISAGVTPTNYQYEPGDVRRYGAVGGGVTDDTAAIQRALDVGGPVFFYHGTYLCAGLTADTDYQTFHFFGRAILRKNANGAILTVSGDRTAFFNARFDGQSASFTGHNLVKSGVHMTLDKCSSYDAEERAVYDSDGNGLRIDGTNDIYHTATGAGYDIEIAGSGLYSKITDIYTSQATGGIYFNQTGSGGGHSVVGCQFGKLTMVGGSGASSLSNNRINGAVTIHKSGVTIGVSSCSANVTIGDGSTTFSGIVIEDGFIMQSGTTFTATAGLQDCTLHVAHLEANGVTVDYSNLSSDNDLYTGWATYTPTWTAVSVNPSLGDGSLTAQRQRNGRNVRVQINLLIGSTTTTGTGVWRFTVPWAIASGIVGLGPADALDSGTNFRTGSTRATTGQSYVTSIFDSAASETTQAVPFTWAVNDRLNMSCEYRA